MSEQYDASSAAYDAWWHEQRAAEAGDAGAIIAIRAKSFADSIPARDIDRSIGHLQLTSEMNLAHCATHVAAAQAAKSPDSVAHNLRHGLSHVRKVSEHLLKERDALRRRVPAVGTQLDNLAKAVPRSVPPRPDLDMGIAHDLSSAIVAAAHVDRHLAECLASHAAGDRQSVIFGLDHSAHHVAEIGHHLSELHAELAVRLPGAIRELDELEALTEPGPMSGGRALVIAGTTQPMPSDDEE